MWPPIRQSASSHFEQRPFLFFVVNAAAAAATRRVDGFILDGSRSRPSCSFGGMHAPPLPLFFNTLFTRPEGDFSIFMDGPRLLHIQQRGLGRWSIYGLQSTKEGEQVKGGDVATILVSRPPTRSSFEQDSLQTKLSFPLLSLIQMHCF